MNFCKVKQSIICHWSCRYPLDYPFPRFMFLVLLLLIFCYIFVRGISHADSQLSRVPTAFHVVKFTSSGSIASLISDIGLGNILSWASSTVTSWKQHILMEKTAQAGQRGWEIKCLNSNPEIQWQNITGSHFPCITRRQLCSSCRRRPRTPSDSIIYMVGQKPDCFWKLITLWRLMGKRCVIYQKFLNVV